MIVSMGSSFGRPIQRDPPAPGRQRNRAGPLVLHSPWWVGGVSNPRASLESFFQAVTDEPLDAGDERDVGIHDESNVLRDDPLKLLANAIEYSKSTWRGTSGRSSPTSTSPLKIASKPSSRRTASTRRSCCSSTRWNISAVRSPTLRRSGSRKS